MISFFSNVRAGEICQFVSFARLLNTSTNPPPPTSVPSLRLLGLVTFRLFFWCSRFFFNFFCHNFPNTDVCCLCDILITSLRGHVELIMYPKMTGVYCFSKPIVPHTGIIIIIYRWYILIQLNGSRRHMR